MKHAPTAKYLLDEFLENLKNSRDFEITGGYQLMENFIGLDVEQSKSKKLLHLDAYIHEMLNFYNEDAHPKSTPKQSSCVLTPGDIPEVPDKKRLAFYR